MTDSRTEPSNTKAGKTMIQVIDRIQKKYPGSEALAKDLKEEWHGHSDQGLFIDSCAEHISMLEEKIKKQETLIKKIERLQMVRQSVLETRSKIEALKAQLQNEDDLIASFTSKKDIEAEIKENQNVLKELQNGLDYWEPKVRTDDERDIRMLFNQLAFVKELSDTIKSQKELSDTIKSQDAQKQSFFKKHPKRTYALIGAAIGSIIITACTFGIGLPALAAAGTAIGVFLTLSGTTATGVGLGLISVGSLAFIGGCAKLGIALGTKIKRSNKTLSLPQQALETSDRSVRRKLTEEQKPVSYTLLRQQEELEERIRKEKDLDLQKQQEKSQEQPQEPSKETQPEAPSSPRSPRASNKQGG